MITNRRRVRWPDEMVDPPGCRMIFALLSADTSTSQRGDVAASVLLAGASEEVMHEMEVDLRQCI